MSLRIRLGLEEIEKAALRLRFALGLVDDVLLDPLDVLRRLKIAGRIKGYVESSDAALDGADARFEPLVKILHLSAKTHLGAEAGLPRQRFTVAHEVGHVELGHAAGRNRRAHGVAIGFGRDLEIDEQEANAFAAAFLMPRHLMGMDESPEQLSAKFGVSLEAVFWRQKDLRVELTDLPSVTDLDDELSASEDYGTYLSQVYAQAKRRREPRL